LTGELDTTSIFLIIRLWHRKEEMKTVSLYIRTYGT
jgi:hypothetical protein